MKTETKIRLTVQEIVDLYTVYKNYTEMTKQIDIYEPYDFWYELKEELEDCQNHIDDWNIYTGMVFEYHYKKDELIESKKAEEALKQEDRLLKFGNWLVDGVEELTMDKEEIQQELYLFLEDEE